ncbi:MAG: RDD family protein [Terriglobales bacterium]
MERTLLAAPLRVRAGAGLVDVGCAAVAGGGFALGLRLTALSTQAVLPAHLPQIGFAAAASLAFPALQFLCLRRQLPTPGMRCLGLTLWLAGGQPAAPKHWRRRAWATLLSCAALGLGFLWAGLDEGHLAWHDRLSGAVLGPCHPAAPGPHNPAVAP